MIQLKEKQILEKIQDFLTNCDEDELAGLVRDLFGGFCKYFMDGEYLFTPNENYMGAFGEDGEDEDNNSHRHQEGYCNDCSGDCQYDDQGNNISK